MDRHVIASVPIGYLGEHVQSDMIVQRSVNWSIA
jgi:hypothetical protein